MTQTLVSIVALLLTPVIHLIHKQTAKRYRLE